MTTEKETHTCSCGHQHIVSKRKITINKEMVHSIWVVYNHLRYKASGDYHFTRKEVSHLFRSESESARFGDLVYFGGILFKEEKGKWGMNMERAELFLSNSATVAEHVVKDPITKAVVPSTERVLMRQVKGVNEFLDGDGNFKVEYVK